MSHDSGLWSICCCCSLVSWWVGIVTRAECVEIEYWRILNKNFHFLLNFHTNSRLPPTSLFNLFIFSLSTGRSISDTFFSLFTSRHSSIIDWHSSDSSRTQLELNHRIQRLDILIDLYRVTGKVHPTKWSVLSP